MPAATIALDRASADIPLTRAAREDLERAAGEAARRGAGESSPVDVLHAVLSNRGSLAVTTLRALGSDPAAVAAALPADGVAATPPLRQLLVNANREAQVLGHYQVDSIHLLLALLYSDSPATSAALQKSGLTMYDLRRHLQTGVRAEAPVAGAPSAGNQAPDRALRRRPLPRLRGVLTVSPVFLVIVAVTVVAGALLWLDVIPSGVGVLTLVFVVSGWIATVCIHEFCHAFVAYLGGDRGVVSSGYLTLDPLRYTNFLMSIVFPAAFLLLGGIALPGGAVYINRGALRSRWWDSAVSLAGPIGTLLCGLFISLIVVASYWLGLVRPDTVLFYEAMSVLAFVEMYAFVLNLVPVPPLDGFGILRPWLPYSIQAAAAQVSTFALIIVFAAIWYVPTINLFFVHSATTLAAMVGVDPYLIYFGQQHFRLLM
ncbi:MAG TPA: Clp protease N-terminal domain-containing protein [Candidatus Dormibacteraeota bacterium]|nr:Clp protease N-terminal domain-containing protein [Candidatus Dormibacteraeota bacterium]